MSGGDKLPDDVSFTHLDEELFDGAGATKRDLIDYLDAVHACMLPCLTDRPLSVIRVRPGQPRSCKRTFPNTHRTGCPEHRSGPRRLGGGVVRLCTIAARCSGSPTNGLEYHVTLFKIAHPEHPDYLVLDLDPPEGAPFAVVVQAAHLVRQALDRCGHGWRGQDQWRQGPARICAARGGASPEDVAAATRAVAVRAERIDPDLGTTAFVKEEREGKVFPTRHVPVVPPSWPRTAHGSGPAYRSRFPFLGRTSTRWSRPTSLSTTRPAYWTGQIRGRTRCRQRSRWTPIW